VSVDVDVDVSVDVDKNVDVIVAALGNGIDTVALIEAVDAAV
jgi:hypothetical protein